MSYYTENTWDRLIRIPGVAAAGLRPELLAAWDLRECFVCAVIGPCTHREPDVEWAIIQRDVARGTWHAERLAHLRALGKVGLTGGKAA